jgi:hypothetical protein
MAEEGGRRRQLSGRRRKRYVYEGGLCVIIEGEENDLCRREVLEEENEISGK